MRQIDEIVRLGRRGSVRNQQLQMAGHTHSQTVSKFTWRRNGRLVLLMNKRHDEAFNARSANCSNFLRSSADYDYWRT